MFKLLTITVGLLNAAIMAKDAIDTFEVYNQSAWDCADSLYLCKSDNFDSDANGSLLRMFLKSFKNTIDQTDSKLKVFTNDLEITYFPDIVVKTQFTQINRGDETGRKNAVVGASIAVGPAASMIANQFVGVPVCEIRIIGYELNTAKKVFKLVHCKVAREKDENVEDLFRKAEIIGELMASTLIAEKKLCPDREVRPAIPFHTHRKISIVLKNGQVGHGILIETTPEYLVYKKNSQGKEIKINKSVIKDILYE